MREMEERHDLLEKKKAELIETIGEEIKQVQTRDSNLKASDVYEDFVISGYIRISPPKGKKLMMSLIIFESSDSYQGGESIKPGNIILNIKNLINSVPEITALAVSVSFDIPILKVCSALSLWKKLRDIMTVEIDRTQAIVVIALWKNCNCEHEIKIDKGFECTNILCRELGENEIGWEKYNKIVDQLIKLQCIEMSEEIIWLREWVSKKYIE